MFSTVLNPSFKNQNVRKNKRVLKELNKELSGQKQQFHFQYAFELTMLYIFEF